VGEARDSEPARQAPASGSASRRAWPPWRCQVSSGPARMWTLRVPVCRGVSGSSSSAGPAIGATRTAVRRAVGRVVPGVSAPARRASPSSRQRP